MVNITVINDEKQLISESPVMGRVFANGPEDLSFNPRSRHTKDFKNGTWYLLA